MARFLEAFGHLRVQAAPAVGAQSLPRIVTIREFWTDPALRNRTAVDPPPATFAQPTLKMGETVHQGVFWDPKQRFRYVT